MRRAVGVLLAVVAVVAGAVPAWAQYPPTEPTCQVDDSVVHPGEEVRVSGQNWQPNSSVRVRFHQDRVAEEYGPFPTDEDGSFSATITIPEEAHDGPAQIAVGGPDRTGDRTRCVIHVTVEGGASPGMPFCTVDDATPAPGQTVKVSGRHWQPRSTVEIRFRQDGRSEHLGTAQVNGGGRFAKGVEIPEDAEDGPAEIVVDGRDREGNPATCRIRITVTSSSSNAGFAVETPASPASLALLAGTIGVIAAGRRRHRALRRA